MKNNSPGQCISVPGIVFWEALLSCLFSLLFLAVLFGVLGWFGFVSLWPLLSCQVFSVWLFYLMFLFANLLVSLVLIMMGDRLSS